jgi:hypothetical protein
LSSTIRTEGAPSAVAVASAIALASFGSASRASANQASNKASGSDSGSADWSSFIASNLSRPEAMSHLSHCPEAKKPASREAGFHAVQRRANRSAGVPCWPPYRAPSK